jgi:hypothetical protein
MLRTLLRMKEPFYIARQEQAPLLRDRESFLEHLLRQGTSLAAARSVSWQLVNVIRLLRLTTLRDVWIDEIENAARRWHGNSTRILSRIPTKPPRPTSSM